MSDFEKLQETVYQLLELVGEKYVQSVILMKCILLVTRRILALDFKMNLKKMI